MTVLNRAIKPEYLFRPNQAARRLWYRVRPPATTLHVVNLPWGAAIAADRHDVIGSALCRLGVYDLPVSEVLWRLLTPGQTAIDVGANCGHMTTLMAARVGPTGTVWAFEPHPLVWASLLDTLRRSSVRGAQRAVLPRQIAVSDRMGCAALHEPDAFATNHGTARIADGVGAYTVPCTTLDAIIPANAGPLLLKVDVEGHEAAVLRGARNLLIAGRVRDIIFEEHAPYPTETTSILEHHGLQIAAIGRSLLGPTLHAPTDRADVPHWEPTSYLATTNLPRAIRRIQRWGWRVLRGR